MKLLLTSLLELDSVASVHSKAMPSLMLDSYQTASDCCLSMMWYCSLSIMPCKVFIIVLPDRSATGRSIMKMG